MNATQYRYEDLQQVYSRGPIARLKHRQAVQPKTSSSAPLLPNASMPLQGTGDLRQFTVRGLQKVSSLGPHVLSRHSLS
jgi:hypothetical protein